MGHKSVEAKAKKNNQIWLDDVEIKCNQNTNTIPKILDKFTVYRPELKSEYQIVFKLVSKSTAYSTVP